MSYGFLGLVCKNVFNAWYKDAMGPWKLNATSKFAFCENGLFYLIFRT